MKGYYGIVKRTKVTKASDIMYSVHASFEIGQHMFARRRAAILHANELSKQFPSHDNTEIAFHVVLGIT